MIKNEKVLWIPIFLTKEKKLLTIGRQINSKPRLWSSLDNLVFFIENNFKKKNILIDLQ